MQIISQPENRTSIHLTFQAALKQDEQALSKVINLQKSALKVLPGDGRVWIYPEDRIHFSILNFNSDECDDYQKAQENLMSQEWYPSFISYVEKSIFPSTPIEMRFTIRRFYTDDLFKNSLALNIFPESSDFLDRMSTIEQEAQEYLNTVNMPLQKFGIKSFKLNEEKYFVINILRFFGREFTTQDELYQFVDEQNRLLATNPIVFTFTRPTLVISDSCLSNDGHILLQ